MGEFLQRFTDPKARFWFRATSAGEVNAPTASDPSEPSLWEVLLMLGMMFAVHILTVCRVRSFWKLPNIWFDRMDYLEIAAIVRHWHFSGGPVPKFFWGFPYAIAGISKLFSMPGPMAVVAISMLGSLAVCILVHRLYGGRVAAVFIFLDYQWIMLSVEGGSEPLFMCFLYASFLAARSSRWKIAALLASLSTTVRPVGVFALLGFAAVLAKRRSYRQLAAITLIGLAIGVLYVVPLWIILGNPFANFVGYRRHWGPHGWALTFPFGALVPSYLSAFHEMRWTLFVFSAIWPIVGLLGIVAMGVASNRQRLSSYQPEALFAWMYALFLFMYNDIDIALALDRYLAPCLPLLLSAMRDWIPRDRRVLWGAAVVSALLSAAAVVSFRNVFGFKLP
jgi:Gpi18-like mannosyltransferase